MTWLDSSEAGRMCALWLSYYTSLGFRVLPCGPTPGAPEGKRPYSLKGRMFMWEANATSDLSEATRLFGCRTDAQIGLVAPYGVTFVDIDNKVHPNNGLRNLAEIAPEGFFDAAYLPIGVACARTPGGGLHIPYRTPADMVEWLGTQRKGLPDGVDIRANGKGYVLAAPSLNLVTGVPYEWLVDLPGALSDLPELPAFIADRLRAAHASEATCVRADGTPNIHRDGPPDMARVDAVMRNALEEIGTAPPGARNNITNRAIHSLGGVLAYEGIADLVSYEAQLLTAMEASGYAVENPYEAKEVMRSALASGYSRPLPPVLPTAGAAGDYLADHEDLSDEEGAVRRSAGADWRAGLSYVQKGKNLVIALCDSNITHILCSHPDLEGLLGYDERKAVCGIMRKSCVFPDDEVYPRNWRVTDSVYLVQWLARSSSGGLLVSVNAVENLIGYVCRDKSSARQYDPFLDYLSGLVWDGESRCDTVLQAAAGVPDSAYIRAVFSKFMISVVARAFEPGCKVDTMLVLYSRDQGLYKSTLFRQLFRPCDQESYFLDHLPDLRDKDAMIQLCGRVIIEHAELAALTKADSARIKAFLSRQQDVYRPPYGRVTESFPRRSVFVGTTNEADFVKDTTGARRFWPVEIDSEIDYRWVGSIRDQLWAEAVHRYHSGEEWYLSESLFQRQQAAADMFSDRPAQTDIIADYLSTPECDLSGFVDTSKRFRPDGSREWTTTTEVLTQACNIPVSAMTSAKQHDVVNALTALRWSPYRPRLEGRLLRAFRAPDGWTMKPTTVAASSKNGEEIRA